MIKRQRTAYAKMALNKLLLAMTVALSPLTAVAQVPAEEPDVDRYTYDYVLLLRGMTKEFNDEIGQHMVSKAEMCRRWEEAEPALRQAKGMSGSGLRDELSRADPQLASLLARIESSLNRSGSDTFSDFEHQLEQAREDVCRDDPAPYFQHFAITYAHCRMTMETAVNTMDIWMPPGVDEARMAAVEHSSREGMIVDLVRDLNAAIPVAGAGWNAGLEMSATGASKTLLDKQAEEYDFEYNAGMGGSGAQSPMAGMVAINTQGSAWVVDDIDGNSIPARFYWDLSRQVQPAAGAGSFFSGLIQNLVGLLQHGLPLDMEQTVTSTVMGREMMSGKSHSIINDVALIPIPSGWCEASMIPDGYAITNVNDEMENAMSGTGFGAGSGGMSAEQQAQMNEAMEQANQALQNMTPEQRAAMESMGLGNLMGNMGAETQQQANPAANTQSQQRTTASSEELQSDNLTEMVQNYLGALGYDVGNANGSMNLETTIAISQFQAENGMQVTGEVSPQLAGILAAKIDQ